MPRAVKFAMVAGPNRSSPTRATMETRAPHSRAATAWLAPLPPKPSWNSRPKMVSPGRGKLVGEGGEVDIGAANHHDMRLRVHYGYHNNWTCIPIPQPAFRAAWKIMLATGRPTRAK